MTPLMKRDQERDHHPEEDAKKKRKGI